MLELPVMAHTGTELVDHRAAITDKAQMQSTSADNPSEDTADYDFHMNDEGETDEQQKEERKVNADANIYSDEKYTTTSIKSEFPSTKGHQPGESYSAAPWASRGEDPEINTQSQALSAQKLMARKAVADRRPTRRIKPTIRRRSPLAKEAHLRSKGPLLKKQTAPEISTPLPQKQSTSMASIASPRNPPPQISLTPSRKGQSTRQISAPSSTERADTRQLRPRDPVDSFMISLRSMNDGIRDMLGQPMPSERVQYPAEAARMQARYDARQAVQVLGRGRKRVRGNEETGSDKRGGDVTRVGPPSGLIDEWDDEH